MKKGVLCTAAIILFFGIWVNASTELNSQELRTILTPDSPGFYPTVNIDEKDRSRNEHADVSMEYRIIQTPGAPISAPGCTYQAINRNQNISAQFNSRGVNLGASGEKDSAWHMTMSLSAFGSSNSMEPVPKTDDGSAHVAGQRIEYPHGSLTEWFENTEEGLEHGFTVFAPPPRPEDHVSPLILEMQLTGSLVPRLNRDSDALAFYEAQGQAVLQYGGLKAWDSLQRILPAKLRLTRGIGNDLSHRLAFVVDDSQAVYPITIDPLFTSRKKLVRLEWSWAYQFGKSVAIDADTVLIGAPMGNKDNGGSTGTAYVYYKEFGGRSWSQIKKIAASNGVTGDDFGTSVAIDGDTAVVCSNNTSSAGDYYNRAYIFYRDQGGADNWGEVKIINMGFSTRFGDSVAIDGDTLVVGDSTADNSGSKTGAVYVYGRNQGGTNAWGLVKKIVANDGQISDNFGYSVAIDGDTIAVGASGDDDLGSNCGAAYIFERNSGGPDNWGQAIKIGPADAAAEDRFGYAVSISGDTLVAGAYLKDGVGANFGAAYVFQRDFGAVGNWGQAMKLTASDEIAEAQFGYAVSVDSGTIIVGAHRADPAGTDSGAAYVYERDAGGMDNWGETRILHNGGAYDLFGCAVGISADTMVVGAYQNTDNGFMAGAAFIHERDDGGADNWGQVRELLPVAGGELPGDHFGKSVDIDEDVAVVGAYAARDSYGSNFGTAYVFERDHLGLDNWGQFKKIGAFSEGASGDQFGWSARVSGDFVIVGAPGDDDMGSGSGSAYIFDRYYDSGNDDWGYDRRKKLRAGDGAAGDAFGYAVDIGGGIAVVGAYLDDDKGTSSGSVYVFEIDAGGLNQWSEVKKIIAYDGAASDNFGFSVAVSGSFIAVGAYGDDDKGSSSGSVYVYERDTGDPGTWDLVKKITSPDGAASDYFGYAVSSSGSALLVGAHGDDDKGSGSGSAYIFEKDTGGTNNWGLVKKLVALDGAASDAFGHSVSIRGNRAVVGAYYDDDVDSASGSAYVFLRNEGGASNWGQVDKLTAPDPVVNAYFGDAVAIFDDMVLVGAHAHDEYGTDSGAAYIFSIPGASCIGDSDSDHDVDGFDLAKYIAEGAFSNMGNFASSFGHINCP